MGEDKEITIMGNDAASKEMTIDGDVPANDRITIDGDAPAARSVNDGRMDNATKRLIADVTSLGYRHRPLRWRNRFIRSTGYLDRQYIGQVHDLFDYADQMLEQEKQNGYVSLIGSESRRIEELRNRLAFLENLVRHSDNKDFNDINNRRIEILRENINQREADLREFNDYYESETRKVDSMEDFMTHDPTNGIIDSTSDKVAVSNYRQEFHDIRRSNKRYRLHQLASGTLTALGIAGMAWAIEKVAPGTIINNLNNPSSIAQTLVENGKQIVERIMTDPTFINVVNILKEGSGVFGVSAILTAIGGGRTLQDSIHVNETQRQLDNKTYENPNNLEHNGVQRRR